MKIYTKKGDKGTTQLLGGEEVKKNHIRINCYGTIDELNAFIGNIYDQKINKENKNILLNIQNTLFNLGSNISCNNKNITKTLPVISKNKVKELENEIDKMEKILPNLKSFILPSGSDLSSKCHIARTICRRAERSLVELSEYTEINPIYLKYINRLSDYLFVLARYILISQGGKEMLWQKK